MEEVVFSLRHKKERSCMLEYGKGEESASIDFEFMYRLIYLCAGCFA